MMERSKKREEDRNKQMSFASGASSFIKDKKSGLNEEVINNLNSLGFNLDQVMLCYSKYKFKTTVDAVLILTRDSDTQLFNHEFIKGNNNLCQLCNGMKNEHFGSVEFKKELDYDEKLKVLKNSKSFYSPRKEILDDCNSKTLVLENFKVDEERIPHTHADCVKPDKSDYFDKSQEESEDICPICLDNKISENYFELKCNHKICMECIKNYFEVSIKDGKVKSFYCLYGGCRYEYTSDLIKTFVSKETWAKYKRYKRNQQAQNLLLSNNQCIQCPYPDCSDVIEIEGGVFNSALTTFASCSRNHKFCLKCREIEDNHSPDQCESTSDHLYNQILKISKKNKFKFKQCPRCRTVIEKDEGCNHIVCGCCDFNFCWLCLKEHEEDHYSLYNFSGCPGLRYGKT